MPTGEIAPSNRINIAIIGLAGMGGAWWGHLPVLLEMPDVQVLGDLRRAGAVPATVAGDGGEKIRAGRLQGVQ